MRNVFLWTLAILVIALAGCVHTPRAANYDVDILDAIRDCKSSGVGRKDKLKPLVCVTVYPGGASVSPLAINAARKVAGTRNKIKFVSRGTGDQYEIEFENTDCVDIKNQVCVEQCDAPVNETAPIGQECKYSVVLTRTEDGRTVKLKLDPIVIIDTE